MKRIDNKVDLLKHLHSTMDRFKYYGFISTLIITRNLHSTMDRFK